MYANVEMPSQVDSCSFFQHYFHTLKGCITVFCLVYHSTMLSQVVLQFAVTVFFCSFLFDNTSSLWLYRYMCYSFSQSQALTSYIVACVFNLKFSQRYLEVPSPRRQYVAYRLNHMSDHSFKHLS